MINVWKDLSLVQQQAQPQITQNVLFDCIWMNLSLTNTLRQQLQSTAVFCSTTNWFDLKFGDIDFSEKKFLFPYSNSF